jgi:GTPase
MNPVIAVVGRPNVGKSTLFNQLTKSQAALIADQPGVTRDRQYGTGIFEDRRFILIDTGGLDEADGVAPEMAKIVSLQSIQAAREADAVIWLVDGRDGLTMMDEKLAEQLRKTCKRLYLAVNKTEGMDAAIITAEFHALGFGQPFAISAKRGSGLAILMQAVLSELNGKSTITEATENGALKFSIIGRPNVGKSTLVNRILGEERVLTFDQPGTTRDSIAIPFERSGHKYILIDTAGIRRRSRINNTVEKISVVRTLKAIDLSALVILVLDAQNDITDQDASLLGMVINSGKAVIIAVNKWDGLSAAERTRVRHLLDRKLGFIDYISLHFISALHGSGVSKLFDSIRKIDKVINISSSPSRLTSILETATIQHQPPLVRGRRIKLKYAHMGGSNPFLIIIHGNQVDHVPDAYRRYLANKFRKELNLISIPVLIEFRKGDNPYRSRSEKCTVRNKRKKSPAGKIKY